MKVEIGKVYSVKLTNSAELVTKFVADNDDHYEIAAPLLVGMTQGGIQLMPGLFTSDLNAPALLYKISIAYISDVRSEVGDAYRESTTGIQVPNKSIIMG